MHAKNQVIIVKNNKEAVGGDCTVFIYFLKSSSMIHNDFDTKVILKKLEL